MFSVPKKKSLDFSASHLVSVINNVQSSSRPWREGIFNQVLAILGSIWRHWALTMRTWVASFVDHRTDMAHCLGPGKPALRFCQAMQLLIECVWVVVSFLSLHLFQEPDFCSSSAGCHFELLLSQPRWHVFWILPPGLLGEGKFLSTFLETDALGRIQRGYINSAV